MFSLTFQGKSYKELHDNILIYMQDMGCDVPPKETAKSSSIDAPLVTPDPALVEKVEETLKSTTIEVDVDGTPWDARIHTLKKSIDKNGRWKLARGVDPILVRKVLAEIEEKSVTTEIIPEVPATIQEPVKVEPPPPAFELKPPSKYAHTLDSFRSNLVVTMATLVNDKKITQEYVKTLNDYFGVKEIWEIFEAPEKVKELYENFCEVGLIERIV